VSILAKNLDEQQPTSKPNPPANQTCLEELDLYTKINELVLKYPKIDTEWLPEKQVSLWLYAIQMP